MKLTFSTIKPSTWVSRAWACACWRGASSRHRPGRTWAASGPGPRVWAWDRGGAKHRRFWPWWPRCPSCGTSATSNICQFPWPNQGSSTWFGASSAPLLRLLFLLLLLLLLCWDWGLWRKTLTLVYISAWKRTGLMFLLGRALWKYFRGLKGPCELHWLFCYLYCSLFFFN